MKYKEGQRVRMTHGESVYVGVVLEHRNNLITVRADGAKGANTFNDWEWRIEPIRPPLPTEPGSIIHATAPSGSHVYFLRNEIETSRPWEVLDAHTFKPQGVTYRWGGAFLADMYPNWEVVHEGGYRKTIEDWKAENERPA